MFISGVHYKEPAHRAEAVDDVLRREGALQKGDLERCDERHEEEGDDAHDVPTAEPA